MEAIAALLGWLTFVAAVVAVITVGALLTAAVQVASGAGAFGGRPLPGGITRRSREIEARIRSHYRPRPARDAEAVGWVSAPNRDVEPDLTPLAA